LVRENIQLIYELVELCCFRQRKKTGEKGSVAGVVYFTLAKIRLDIRLNNISGFLRGIFPDFLLQLLAANVATVLPPKPLLGKGEEEEAAADLSLTGGRPRGAGEAGKTRLDPVCGLRRSTDTVLCLPTMSTMKNFGQPTLLHKGPRKAAKEAECTRLS
jgi:hypothetical protein